MTRDEAVPPEEGGPDHVHTHAHSHTHGESHRDVGAHMHAQADDAGSEWHQDRMHDEDLVLDIGGDVGALVIETDARWAEREIEVSPLGDDARRTHTAVHERRIGSELRYVAVFAALPAAEYRVWVDEPGLADRVVIVGGEVATLAWAVPAPHLPDAARGTEQEGGR